MERVDSCSGERKMRLCKCGCGKSIEHKHKNAKFYNNRHKDKYWNRVNPRGIGVLRTSEGYKIADGTAVDEWDEPVYDVDDYEDFGDTMYWDGKDY